MKYIVQYQLETEEKLQSSDIQISWETDPKQSGFYSYRNYAIVPFNKSIEHYSLGGGVIVGGGGGLGVGVGGGGSVGVGSPNPGTPIDLSFKGGVNLKFNITIKGVLYQKDIRMMKGEKERAASITKVGTETFPLNDILESFSQSRVYKCEYSDVGRHEPYQYQFYQKRKGIDNSFVPLGYKQLLNQLASPISAKSPFNIVEIRCKVFDGMGFEYWSNSLEEIVKNDGSRNKVSSVQEYYDEDYQVYENEKDRIFKTNILISQVVLIQSERNSSLEDKCINDASCSGHGTCNLETKMCNCEEGWASINCAFSKTESEDISTILVNVLNDMSIGIANNRTNSDVNLQYFAIVDQIARLSFNNLATMQKVLEFYTNTMNLSDISSSSRRLLSQQSQMQPINHLRSWQTLPRRLQTIDNNYLNSLTTEHISHALDTMNNMLNFLRDNQCPDLQKEEFGKDLTTNMPTYMETITKVNLGNVRPGDPAVLQKSEHIDVFSQKFLECDLQNEELQIGSQIINMKLFTRIPDSCLATREVDVEIIILDSNMFNCTNRTINKNIVLIRITSQPDGEDITEDYSAIMKTEPGVKCPGQCEPKNEQNECVCNTLGTFDLKDQFQKLLAQSRISQILNFSSLSNWDFHKSSTFYTLVGFTIFTGLSIVVLLKTKLKDFCVVDMFKNKRKNLSKFKIASSAFFAEHPLIGIYIYKDKEITKIARLMVFFSRFIMIFAYSSVFLTKANTKVEGEDGEVSYGPSGDIYFILFQYVTIIPVYALLMALIKTKPEYKNKEQEVIPMPKSTKVRVTIGYIILFFFIFGLILGSFIIDAQMTHNERIRRMIIFAQAFLQDFIATPIVDFGIQLGALLALSVKKIRSIKFVKKLLEGSIIHEQIKDLIQANNSDDPDVIIKLKTLFTKKRIPSLIIPKQTMQTIQKLSPSNSPQSSPRLVSESISKENSKKESKTHSPKSSPHSSLKESPHNSLQAIEYQNKQSHSSNNQLLEQSIVIEDNQGTPDEQNSKFTFDTKNTIRNIESQIRTMTELNTAQRLLDYNGQTVFTFLDIEPKSTAITKRDESAALTGSVDLKRLETAKVQMSGSNTITSLSQEKVKRSSTLIMPKLNENGLCISESQSKADSSNSED